MATQILDPFGTETRFVIGLRTVIVNWALVFGGNINGKENFLINDAGPPFEPAWNVPAAPEPQIPKPAGQAKIGS